MIILHEYPVALADSIPENTPMYALTHALDNKRYYSMMLNHPVMYLDNSAFELGKPQAYDLNLIGRIRPKYVFCPDYFGDAYKTTEEVYKFIEQHQEYFMINDIGFATIVQGETLNDVVAEILYYYQFPQIEVVAFPYKLKIVDAKGNLYNRVDLLNLVIDKAEELGIDLKSKKIHFLGLAHITELANMAKSGLFDYIYSLDTSYPIMRAYENKVMSISDLRWYKPQTKFDDIMKKSLSQKTKARMLEEVDWFAQMVELYDKNYRGTTS